MDVNVLAGIAWVAFCACIGLCLAIGAHLEQKRKR